MIRIINLKSYKQGDKEVLIKCDRTSPVGNPFWMTDESKRDEVCDKYVAYFEKEMKKGGEFARYIHYIKELSKKFDVALGCHCAPKRCHCQTIKEFIEGGE